MSAFNSIQLIHQRAGLLTLQYRNSFAGMTTEVLQDACNIIKTYPEKSQGEKSLINFIYLKLVVINLWFSFNFPTTSTSLSSTVTHLSSQHYSICFRRASGYCAVCFWSAIAITTVPNPVSTQVHLINFFTQNQKSVNDLQCGKNLVKTTSLFFALLSRFFFSIGIFSSFPHCTIYS